MGWNEETAVEEYRWVRLMASFKYDGFILAMDVS
jgi:hypothetical protein